MRIGISCYPTIGGSGAVATELGKALAKKGHQVHFIVTDVPFRLGEFHQNIYIHELDTMSYPVLRTPPYDLSLAALMADIVKTYQLDVLHVHYALPFAVCAFLARSIVKGHRFGVVTTLHGTDVTVLSQDKALYEVIRLGIEQSDVVTAVSQHLAMQTKALFRLDKEIRCVYNFVDPDVFHPQRDASMRNCFGAQGGKKLLLHISNFRRVKRIDDVIRVFAGVRERMPARLLLVGEGPELPTARELVHSLRLAEDVVFLGKQDQVAPICAAADLLLLPSEKESFGLVALEAMACGVPVVGTSAGGIPEVVRHGETGYLANVGDVPTMIDYAVRLLQDADLYRRFADASVRRARTEFHLDGQVAEYEAIYASLCGGRA